MLMLLMLLVKCRRRYSSQNGLGLGGPALWVRARVVHPQVCPFGPQIGHADKPCPCTLREEVSTSTTGSGCVPGAPMVRTIKHTKFSGCRCIRYAARSTGRGLNNIFRNWRVGMSPHMPPGAQRLSNQEGPKSVTVSRFLSAFFYVKSPVRFSF